MNATRRAVRQVQAHAARFLYGARCVVLPGAECQTVRHWLHLNHAPFWRKPHRGSVLDAAAAYLDRHWSEDRRNTALTRSVSSA